jgi:hypothetical protein
MRILLVAILFFPLLVFGTTPSPKTTGKIFHYLDAYVEVDGGSRTSNRDVAAFIERLETKRSSMKDQKAFVGYLFQKTHRRFLKSYTEYVSFSQTLKRGTYNCLTGTALYALLLDHFEIPYQIIETNYHIFLLANTKDGQVLLEATDPQRGFLDDAATIESRINQYKLKTIKAGDDSRSYYQYNANLYKEVSLDEMRGLMHYNRAVVAYNEHNLPAAVTQLLNATALYQSPRITEFSRIVLLTVLESKLEPPIKAECIKQIQSIRKGQLNLSATRNR